KDKIEFLGYKISENKVEPITKRSESIMNYKKPSTKKQMMRFLGLINYDRSFIPNLSGKVKQFYEILDKNKTKLVWNEELNKNFDEIKNIWSSQLERHMPNKHDEFLLETDASNMGIGAVLKQNDRSIAYVSRVLKGSEKNYSITERETLAALWSMEKLEQYLYGRKFTLISDHKAIEEILRKKDSGTPRIQRWMERFSKFDFNICYREVFKLEQADTLSRMFFNLKAEGGFISTGIENKVLDLHIKYSHRKTLKKLLEQSDIKLTYKKINEILKNCKTCCKVDRLNISTAK
ncbi:Retrovirus-related Pol polyprotein from transposon 17.6, partial [Dictyocoela muelleri]